MSVLSHKHRKFPSTLSKKTFDELNMREKLSAPERKVV